MEITHTPAFYMDYLETDKVDQPPFGHCHDTFELCFFLTADMNIFVKDINYEIRGGALLLINPFDFHKIVHSAKGPYTRYVVNFHEAFASSFLEKHRQEELLEKLRDAPYKKAPLTLAEQSELRAAFEALYRNFRQKHPDGARQRLLLASGLFAILSKLEQLGERGQERPLYKKEQLIQDMIRYLDHNLGGDVNLDALEEQYHLSKYHISHTFREVTGTGLWEYLQQRRVMRAQYLLRSTALSIDEIYYQCGYNSAQNFYKSFRKITGVTPAGYRKGAPRGEG